MSGVIMTSECTVDGCLWSDRSTASAVNHIGGVMVSVLASSAVDHGLSSDWVKPKDYNICCFSANTQHKGERVVG